MKKSKNVAVPLALKFIGIIVCTLPAVIATLSYFPLWIARENASILSGLSLVLLIIAAVPLAKYAKSILKSPSAHTVWLIIFVIFFLLSRIASEITVISFVGFISNVIGAIILKASDKIKEKENTNEREL